MDNTQRSPACLLPDWPAPAHVHALTTLRQGGYSSGSFASFNLATHTGDDPVAVHKNRALLRSVFGLPAEPIWLHQVHGARVIEGGAAVALAEADGSRTASVGTVCAVMTADCLPVLICDSAGKGVAAAHAGWRGLHAGVISTAVKSLGSRPTELLVWLGPAIGPSAFEVGPEVFQAFIARDANNVSAFRQTDDEHWLCDIYGLARIELAELGVTSIFGGDACTFTDQQRFFSYRRDRRTGRMASFIWLE